MDIQARSGFALGTDERKQAILWWGNPRSDLKHEAPETRTRYFDAYAHPRNLSPAAQRAKPRGATMDGAQRRRGACGLSKRLRRSAIEFAPLYAANDKQHRSNDRLHRNNAPEPNRVRRALNRPSAVVMHECIAGNDKS
jgi:hypothetical protein